ncbi:hypothetical protein FOL47_010600 [Perkinsus chesapeaki]|uniref:Uncharacterized protein n=1 Tax=Perkinsus chesapeaki TaxID=330153 RepID=A0A7J6L3E7_PERCH|nr:hypothetical protein FOL47_010600 [Perkinsus chesapeaki]
MTLGSGLAHEKLRKTSSHGPDATGRYGFLSNIQDCRYEAKVDWITKEVWYLHRRQSLRLDRSPSKNFQFILKKFAGLAGSALAEALKFIGGADKTVLVIGPHFFLPAGIEATFVDMFPCYDDGSNTRFIDLSTLDSIESAQYDAVLDLANLETFLSLSQSSLAARREKFQCLPAVFVASVLRVLKVDGHYIYFSREHAAHGSLLIELKTPQLTCPTQGAVKVLGQLPFGRIFMMRKTSRADPSSCSGQWRPESLLPHSDFTAVLPICTREMEKIINLNTYPTATQIHVVGEETVIPSNVPQKKEVYPASTAQSSDEQHRVSNPQVLPIPFSAFRCRPGVTADMIFDYCQVLSTVCLAQEIGISGTDEVFKGFAMHVKETLNPGGMLFNIIHEPIGADFSLKAMILLRETFWDDEYSIRDEELNVMGEDEPIHIMVVTKLILGITTGRMLD